MLGRFVTLARKPSMLKRPVCSNLPAIVRRRVYTAWVNRADRGNCIDFAKQVPCKRIALGILIDASAEQIGAVK